MLAAIILAVTLFLFFGLLGVGMLISAIKHRPPA